MINLVIPEASPSLNIMRGKHWSHHYSLRKHWSMLVLVAKSEAHVRLVEPVERAAVNIVREGFKLLDTDNFVGGLKCVIDSLREQRLIVDDSPAHMTLTTAQILIPKKSYPRTLVEIKSL